MRQELKSDIMAGIRLVNNFIDDPMHLRDAHRVPLVAAGVFTEAVCEAVMMPEAGRWFNDPKSAADEAQTLMYQFTYAYYHASQNGAVDDERLTELSNTLDTLKARWPLLSATGKDLRDMLTDKGYSQSLSDNYEKSFNYNSNDGYKISYEVIDGLTLRCRMQSEVMGFGCWFVPETIEQGEDTAARIYAALR